MTLRDRLIEAENALHDLETGRAVAEVTDQNGERVRYSLTTSTRLKNYIADLKRQIDGKTSGPMNFWGC